jgi:hypothetical protein
VRRKLGNKGAFTEDEQKQKDWEKQRDVNLSWKVKKERERERERISLWNGSIILCVAVSRRGYLRQLIKLPLVSFFYLW